MHGFALNVNTDLGYFNHIVPCGIADPAKTVTSMSYLLGRTVPLAEVRDAVCAEFSQVFELELHAGGLADLATASPELA